MPEHPVTEPSTPGAPPRREGFFETIFARSRDALFVMDAGSGAILAVSDAACEFLGRPRKEMVGHHRMELFPPESAEVYEAAFSDHLARSNAIPHSVVFERADGTRIEGELSAVIVDPLGAVVLQVVFRGIRERLEEAEERVRKAARARERQKLEAVALLAGGVAHEINNVLAGILTSSSLLLQAAANGPQPRDAVAIVAAVRRGKSLTQNLVGFAQRGMYRKDVIPVNRVLAEAATVVRKALPHGVQLHTDLQSTRSVTGDPGQLAEAVMNGCLNAVEAMGRGGTLTLTSSDVELSPAELEGWPDATAGSFARIQVRDTGHGMDAGTVSRAFDPFYTTKSIGESAGLGLSMVYGVVRHHLGRVYLESTVGVGTTLTLDLPQAAEFGVVTPPSAPSRTADRGGSVLIVDDDEWVRSTTRDLLKSVGRTVLEARDGVEAVEVYGQHAGEIAFVLLDLRMPRMDGAEALRRLVHMDPEVRVILFTGFDRDQVSKDLFALGRVGFLRKPFELPELLQQEEFVWQERAQA